MLWSIYIYAGYKVPLFVCGVVCVHFSVRMSLTGITTGAASPSVWRGFETPEIC